MDLQYRFAIWLCNMDLQHGFSIWIFSMDFQNGFAKWICGVPDPVPEDSPYSKFFVKA